MTLAQKLQRVLLLSSFRVVRSVEECERSLADPDVSEHTLGYLESLPDDFNAGDMQRIDELWRVAS